MKFRKMMLLVAIPVLIAGCASSTTGPGAGAKESTVKGSVDDVNKRAEDTFQQMNIQKTGSAVKNQGNERELTGKYGDSDIKVVIDNAGESTSHVTVTASKNFVSGQQDVAKTVLDKIVQQS